MNLAVIGTSRKENEKRVAIHPNHIQTIPEKIRRQLFFEKGYGIPFGISDEKICSLTGNRLESRRALLENFHSFLIPKPVLEDFEDMRDGSLVWGWIHGVQQSTITQIAIDKKLTLIAWENMNFRGERGRTHIFQKNNEMAGYCGVQHALQLRGIDGNFGLPRKVAVLSLGSVSRGAIYALKGHGFEDITVYTKRPPFLVSDRIPGISYRQMKRDKTGKLVTKNLSEGTVPLIDELTQADIIVNGILQDTSDPVIFIDDSNVKKFQKECLVIDISCDTNMGFSFAHTTDSSAPFFKIGNIIYYSIDHTPTLLWDSASWEISNCILPFLASVVEQTENEVINCATDIRNGVIINKEILSYQHRSPVYPYKKLKRAVSQKKMRGVVHSQKALPITLPVQNHQNFN